MTIKIPYLKNVLMIFKKVSNNHMETYFYLNNLIQLLKNVVLNESFFL